MQVLDASSAIHAWDNYPIDQFPPLWDWLAKRIAAGEVTIPVVALDEVVGKSPASGIWMKAQKVSVLPMTEGILMDALRIKTLLGIYGDVYGSGVGENDLLIIATARAYGAELLTDEAPQPNLPLDRRRYKIPAVCGLPDVQVPCLSFIAFLKRSKAVFV